LKPNTFGANLAMRAAWWNGTSLRLPARFGTHCLKRTAAQQKKRVMRDDPDYLFWRYTP
jgi:hypothetical protein